MSFSWVIPLFFRPSLMDPSPTPSYELILGENQDTEDHWWFLRNAVEEANPCELQNEPRSAILDTTETGQERTDVPLGFGRSISTDALPCLAETEMDMLEKLCVKYDCTPEFRKDLLNLIVIFLTLQKMEVVEAESVAVQGMFWIQSYITSANGYCIAIVATVFTLVLTRYAQVWLLNFFRCRRTARAKNSFQLIIDPEAEVMCLGKTEPGEITDILDEVGVRFCTVQKEEKLENLAGVDKNEAAAIWSEWYEGMTDELENNIECWSPR